METSQTPVTPPPTGLPQGPVPSQPTELPQALATPAELIPDFGFSSFLAQADEVILGVLVVLTLMSVATWFLILNKGIGTWLLRRRAMTVAKRFWAAESLTQALTELDARPSADVFSELIRQGVGADAHYRQHRPQTLGEAWPHSEFVTRALRQSIEMATTRLEGGLTLLASVGSTAPFVGLFGTVWGIYHALIRIGVSGQATLEQVAGPVGEALIMTALGLAVAVPAVLAYNAFVRANRMILANLDGCAHDLHTYLTTGARVEGSANRVANGHQKRSAVLHVAREATT
jgi:biopolymer transport protein ExbB